MIRVLLAGAGALVLWLVAATEVPDQVRMPVEGVVLGATVSQPFGCTSLALEPIDPMCPLHHIHTGVDLAAASGTEVHSATAGLAFIGYDPAGAGQYVEVFVDSRVRVLYCHLSAFRVQAGDHVMPGQVIGLVGATGLATGPHVHLQIEVDGVPIDPAVFLSS